MVLELKNSNQFSNEENLKKINSLLKSDLLTKWLLLLFASNNFQPSKGKVLLTKQAFLLAYEIKPDLAEAFQFFPYQYGPYSTELAKRINRLLDVKWIKSERKRGQWHFLLTGKGKRQAEIAKHDLEVSNEILVQIDEMKRSSSRKSLRALLREIYSKYPAFSVASRIIT